MVREIGAPCKWSFGLRSGVTKFLYDGTRLIGEYNGSNALLRRYVHGDGVDDPIVWYDSSGTTNKRNLFKDERGSVIAADTGSAVTTLKYDEYGNATVTGSTAPRFRYTGQTWLPELGLYYYKARMYNPDLGRFMQTDPIGTKIRSTYMRMSGMIQWDEQIRSAWRGFAQAHRMNTILRASMLMETAMVTIMIKT